MIVLAHRGNVRGPQPARENRLDSVEEALRLGFGLETDVRGSSSTGFYISHDPEPPSRENRLEAHAALWARYPSAIVALNIKELGHEAELIAALRRLGVLPQIFLFDMELIEPRAGETARLFRRLDSSVRIAARVSDRGESLERALAIEAASVVWLDEFDRSWATQAVVVRLKEAGKSVFAVSPELHGRSREEAQGRWRDFARWSADGICTDWPAEIAAMDNPPG